MAAEGVSSPGAAWPAEADLPVQRKLNMEADFDSATESEGEDLMTIYELLQEVDRLESIVLQMSTTDNSEDDTESECGDFYPSISIDQSPTMRHSVHALDARSSLHRTGRSGSGAYDLRRSSVSSMGRDSDVSSVRGGAPSEGFTTPTKPLGGSARVMRTDPRPTTRVAALTRENISLLPTPRRLNTFTGSVCGSHTSKTSVRTDGGAVFSRLYQPDFYKTRELKLQAIRDRQENINLGSFMPKTNSRRMSISSRDGSVGGNSSIGSMQSAKTDVTNVSSRLYDPEYLRRRSARLNRMKEERELRDCTFAPTINRQPK